MPHIEDRSGTRVQVTIEANSLWWSPGGHHAKGEPGASCGVTRVSHQWVYFENLSRMCRFASLNVSRGERWYSFESGFYQDILGQYCGPGLNISSDNRLLAHLTHAEIVDKCKQKKITQKHKNPKTEKLSFLDRGWLPLNIACCNSWENVTTDAFLDYWYKYWILGGSLLLSFKYIWDNFWNLFYNKNNYEPINIDHKYLSCNSKK